MAVETTNRPTRAEHDANVDGQHDEMETREDCPACNKPAEARNA